MFRMVLAAISIWFASAVAAQVGNLFSGAPASSSPPPFNTTVFNCSSGFATTGACGVQFGFTGPTENFASGGGSASGSPSELSGTDVNLVPAGCTHCGMVLNWQAAVNIHSGFQSTFTFVPNGWNISLVLNNNTNQLFGQTGPSFTSGAGCEGGFFQGSSVDSTSDGKPPNFVFAVELDSWSSLVGYQSSDFNDMPPNVFSYSSAQIYNDAAQPPGTPPGPTPASNYPGQSPCNPDLFYMDPNINFTYVGVGKYSTYPVPLTTGCTGTTCTSSSLNTTTGDNYSVTITYLGGGSGQFTLDMYDITAGGTCAPVTSGTCYHQAWSVDIETIVGANTAYIGLSSGSNDPVSNNLLVHTWNLKTP